MKKKSVNFNKDEILKWLVLPQSFFQCALICARTLEIKLSEENSPYEKLTCDPCFKKIYGDFPKFQEYLIFPIIYNFKHGIELYLKAIAGIKNQQYKKDHDIIALYQAACIESDEVLAIIIKYYKSHLFLPNNNNKDIKNVFERYPQDTPYDDWNPWEHRSNGKIVKALKFDKFSSYWNWYKSNNIETREIVTPDKIRELIKDIESTYEKLREISNKTEFHDRRT